MIPLYAFVIGVILGALIGWGAGWVKGWADAIRDIERRWAQEKFDRTANMARQDREGLG